MTTVDVVPRLLVNFCRQLTVAVLLISPAPLEHDPKSLNQKGIFIRLVL